MEVKVSNRLIPACVVLAALVSFSVLTSMAQNPQRGQQPPAGPAPRWPDGRINLGTIPGEKGVWQGDGRLVRVFDALVSDREPPDLSRKRTVPDPAGPRIAIQ